MATHYTDNLNVSNADFYHFMRGKPWELKNLVYPEPRYWFRYLFNLLPDSKPSCDQLAAALASAIEQPRVGKGSSKGSARVQNRPNTDSNQKDCVHLVVEPRAGPGSQTDIVQSVKLFQLLGVENVQHIPPLAIDVNLRDLTILRSYELHDGYCKLDLVQHGITIKPTPLRAALAKLLVELSAFYHLPEGGSRLEAIVRAVEAS